MNTQKKLSRLVMVVSLVAFGMGFGLAKNTIMGKTGVILDLPSGFTITPSQKGNDYRAGGKNDSELAVAVISKIDPQSKGLNVNNAIFSQLMVQMLSSGLPDFKLIKQDKLIVKNIEFIEIQATAKMNSAGDRLYTYMAFTIYNDKTIVIMTGSPIKKLAKNRSDIAKIIGSITLK
jgi:hypothetical protein